MVRGVIEKTPRHARLTCYSALAGDFPTTIDVAPATFADMRVLYEKNELAKTRFAAAPASPSQAVTDECTRVTTQVDASVGSLAEEPAEIAQLGGVLDELLADIAPIYDRYDFINEVCGLVSAQPGKDVVMDAGKGPLWTYGRMSSRLPGVSIATRTVVFEKKHHGLDRYTQTVRLGGGNDEIIVGWQVQDEWDSATNGHWWQASDGILMEPQGSVFLKGDKGRGVAWAVTVATVPRADYAFTDVASREDVLEAAE